MPTLHGGRHEHGQNYLVDPATITHTVQLLRHTTGTIVEIGPGRGALTRHLARLNRRVIAVEIDQANVAELRSRLPGPVEIVHADFLEWRSPRDPHVLVGNIPFHLTTAMLRRILHSRHWTDAILLVQWEVARRRAGVGGASMMTAQWWPWIDFTLEGRVPRSAFRPVPQVDGGLLRMVRRGDSLIGKDQQPVYRAFVHAVFTGRGRGVESIVAPMMRGGTRAFREWSAREGVHRHALPKDLTASQWATLFERALAQGWSVRKGNPTRARHSPRHSPRRAR